jgi:hypothetical protein
MHLEIFEPDVPLTRLQESARLAPLLSMMGRPVILRNHLSRLLLSRLTGLPLSDQFRNLRSKHIVLWLAELVRSHRGPDGSLLIPLVLAARRRGIRLASSCDLHLLWRP